MAQVAVLSSNLSLETGHPLALVCLKYYLDDLDGWIKVIWDHDIHAIHLCHLCQSIM